MRTFRIEYGLRSFSKRYTRIVEAEHLMEALLVVSHSRPDDTLVYYRAEMLSEEPTLRE